MAAVGSLRCTLCGIAYPPLRDFLTCPIHEEATEPDPGHDADPDWREKAQRLWRQLKAAALEPERPYPRVENVPVLDEGGQLFVKQTDLIRAGLRIPVHSPSFQLFELDGYVYEIEGWDEPRRRWWVERVAPSIVLVNEEQKQLTVKTGA